MKSSSESHVYDRGDVLSDSSRLRALCLYVCTVEGQRVHVLSKTAYIFCLFGIPFSVILSTQVTKVVMILLFDAVFIV